MKRFPFARALACAAAALAGYLLADRLPMVAPATGTRHAESTRGTSHAVDQAVQPEIPAVTVRSPREVEETKKHLIELFSRSISPNTDWAMRSQASAILATMSAGELEAFSKELGPSIKSWGGLRWADGEFTLFKEVLLQWGLKDPENACLSTNGTPYRFPAQIFHQWLKRDPEAARAWVIRGQFPPGKEKEGAALRQQLVNGMATTDLSEARESLALLDAEAQKTTLLEWSARLAHDPAKRDELLALLASRGDPEFSLKCHERLVREMANKSPREAYEFIEATHLPDEQKHALSQQMLGVWASKDPHQAFAAWAELKEAEAPAPLLKAMDSWSLNSPGAEESIEWVNKLETGPARDQFKKHMLLRMSNMDRFQQAADLASGLDDPAERLRHMRLVKRQWDEGWPQGAKQWFDKLPEADKEALLK